jgi:hypothetical protein
MEAAGPALGKNYFDAPWVRASGYYWVYLTRPDDTMTILGDWWPTVWATRCQPPRAHLLGYVTGRLGEPRWAPASLRAAATPARPEKGTRSVEPALVRPRPARPPVSDLPPSRLFQADKSSAAAKTLAVLRSGWGPDARLITFSMGDWLGHHDHYDSNSFSIHYKEDLAIDPGYGGEKDIDWTYYRRTVAHNSLLGPCPEAQAVKDDPRLKERGWGYDGGQRVPLPQDRPRNQEQFFALKNPEYPDKSLFETGDCLAFDTRPTYDYVAGDATRAYHRSQLTRWVRHLVFLKPDVLVVYDVVETPPGRQPRWLLQTVNKPTIQSGSRLVARSGPAELRVQTLLPAQARRHLPPTPTTSPFGPQTSVAPLYRPKSPRPPPARNTASSTSCTSPTRTRPAASKAIGGAMATKSAFRSEPGAARKPFSCAGTASPASRSGKVQGCTAARGLTGCGAVELDDLGGIIYNTILCRCKS